MVSAVTEFAAFSDKVNHYTRSVMKSGNSRHLSSLPILLALLLVLPGCAWLPGGKKADDKAATQAIADGAAALTEAPANPSFDIRVEVDDDELKALVERHNDLQRYRAVPDLDESEFARVMAVAESDVRDLLGTEGYFNPRIELRREAQPGTRPVVVIAITPGEPTTVRKVNIDTDNRLAMTAAIRSASNRPGWTSSLASFFGHTTATSFVVKEPPKTGQSASTKHSTPCTGTSGRSARAARTRATCLRIPSTKVVRSRPPT